MKHLAAAMTVLLVMLIGAPTPAAAQEACGFYRVKRGDDLMKISKRAYGYNNYRSIYRANKTKIGRNPNRISIGLVLALPCRDGSLPGRKKVEPAKPEAKTASFVTANGYLPYTDESLEGQGMFTHLVTKAMLRAAPETSFEVVFVNDWSAHMETLLPRQAFDASFPWTQPGCETQGELTPVELYACQNFLYSDPFYEIVDGFFSKAGSGFEAATDFRQLTGATLCRPEGYPTGHLEERNLMPPEITLVQPGSATACFDMLMAGQVDLVALDTRAGEHVMAEMGLDRQVAENPHLFSIEPLRVALHKDNPDSEALIRNLNTGLEIMLQSGEWGAIVTDSLKEQASLVN